MPEITMGLCNRDNWCVDCDNDKCWHRGDIGAECPKYNCDNGFDCENCQFIADLYKETHGGVGWINKD